jgi:GntR family transcriptional regulator
LPILGLVRQLDRPSEEPWSLFVGGPGGHVVSTSQTADTANLVEWAKLALTSPQAQVLRVTRTLHDASGCSIAFEEVVLVLDEFPGLTANGGDVPDIIELAQCYGVMLGRASERMSIVRASKDVAMHLGIAAGSDVLKLDRIAETVDGKPVEWRVAFRKS